METEQLAKLSINESGQPHLPDELLIKIFSHYQLPTAAAIGQARYETLNIPKGPLIRSPIKSYVDNELYSGACTHQHEDWRMKLRTLSATSRSSHHFRELAIPLLYHIYPGQTLVKPKLFLRSCQSHPDYAANVKEMVVDPWNGMNGRKIAAKAMRKLDFGEKLVTMLEAHAHEWNDEEYALLLFFRCPNVSVLDITCPSASTKDSAMLLLFERVRELAPCTLATDGQDTDSQTNTAMTQPLRNLKHLHLHHAENMYVRSIDSFEPLMQVKTVEMLTAYRFWDGAASINTLGHLQELTLWRCSFKPRELLNGLVVCTDLKSLHIIFAGFKAILGNLVPENDPVDFRALGQLVRSKLKKLHTLRIDDRELQGMHPLLLGSFKSGPMLRDLAINEAALGCYDVADQSGHSTASGNKAVAAMARFRLANMLPSTLRSLSILRSDLWWHEADNQGQSMSRANEDTGLVYDSNAIHDKVFRLISHDLQDYPHLSSIHVDTPLPFGKDVKEFGWSSERVVGDPKLERPSIVTNSLMTPKDKKVWDRTQEERAAKPSVLLRRKR